jgi:hypothetical protein
MSGLLKNIWNAMNGDLLGREEHLEKEHAELGTLFFVGAKGRGHWEAEIKHPTLPHKFSILLPGTTRGPEPSQVAFVRATLSDLDELFLRCEEAIRAEYPKWSKQPWPAKWREVFVIDSIQVPKTGDRTTAWHACYFAKSANRYFTVHFANGEVRELVVDG